MIFQLSNQSLFINKKFEYMENINLKAIRFSLFLKVVISTSALYVAIMSDKLNIGLLYLVMAIVFAGLFYFQLKYYRKKKAERGNDRNWSRKEVKPTFKISKTHWQLWILYICVSLSSNHHHVLSPTLM